MLILIVNKPYYAQLNPLCSDKLEDLLLASRSAYAVDNFTVLDYYQRRNAEDAEFTGKLGVFIYVDLAYEQVLSFSRDLIYERKHHTAGAAPICIEIKQSYALVVSYLIKIIVIKSYS